MSRRYETSTQTCHLCGQQVAPGDRLVKHHGHWIHRTCAPGADE